MNERIKVLVCVNYMKEYICMFECIYNHATESIHIYTSNMWK